MTSKLWRVLSPILFKILTRMKLQFSNSLGDYSYSFQGSSELISITVTVSLFFLENAVTGNNSPQEFSRTSVRIFLIFSARGRGRESSRRQEGVWVGFLLKMPGGGVSDERGWVGARVWEGVCGEFGGGLGALFFSRPKNSHRGLY